MTPRNLLQAAEKLTKVISSYPGKQIRSEKVKGSVRAMVQDYFQETRGLISTLDTSSLDTRMQTLYALTSKNATAASYKSALHSIKKLIQEAELALIIAPSNPPTPQENAGGLSHTDGLIVETLEELLPNTALSYKQVIADLGEAGRLSYRGTATELREVVREVLDHLAPDDDVIKSDSFVFEKDRERPTMQQKAKYILRLRGQARKAIEVPKKALEVIENTVSALVRSTYDRGSIATHTQTGLSKPSIQQLKMYVDGVLCELLEIHSRM